MWLSTVWIRPLTFARGPYRTDPQPRRDLWSVARLLPWSWRYAPAVERSRRDGYECDRRRRGTASCRFAWAHRQAGTDAVAVTYFGDGAVNIGSVLESFNLAAAWDLPICFFIENNQYAVSTHVAEPTGEPRLSARGLGFNIPSWKVDGMDPLAVHLAMQEALTHMRSGKGPTIIEADVYRFFHQNGPIPGQRFRLSHEGRRKGLEKARSASSAHRSSSPSEAADGSRRSQAVAQASRVMQEIGGELLETVPGGKPGEARIKTSEWPDVNFVDVGIRGDLSEFEGARFVEPEEFAGEMVDRKFIDVVAEVMDRRMDADNSIVVMGEDIHRLKGGTNGATKGLADRYPGRVLGTPISENAFAGLGGGIALDGRYKPVVEFMYADFMWVAADQIFNQIGKARHMFGGDSGVPFVLRSKVAMGTGYGSQHSMDPAGVFATAPGWRIVAPSTPYDYIGLMNSALQCNDPVVVIEHVDLYGTSGQAPTDDYDYSCRSGRPQFVGAEAISRSFPTCRWWGIASRQWMKSGQSMPRSSISVGSTKRVSTGTPLAKASERPTTWSSLSKEHTERHTAAGS